MITKNNPKHWILIGILLGLAFLNKYSILFYIFGFFIALLFSSYRKIFNSGYFYFSIILGLIIISPNLFWQYNHGWPVVYHMGELQKTQMVNLTYADFFSDIFSMGPGSSMIWIAGLAALLFFKQETKFRFIGTASFIVIILFLVLKGKGYYILGLIPFLFAAGGYIMEKYLTGRMRLINYLVLFISITVSFLLLPFGLPVLSFDKLNEYRQSTDHLPVYPFYRWEDGKIHNISQIYADMTGWHELACYAGKAYNQISPEERKRCTIFIENDYGNAGAIHFYGKEYNLPDAVTFLESYVMWAPDTIPDGPLIYINSRIGDINKLFKKVTKVGNILDPYSREKGLMIYLCSDPAVNVKEVYHQRALNEKKLYQRKISK